MATREIDDTSSEITYRGVWVTNGSRDSLNGALHLTTTQGSTARITFQGTRIVVKGLTSPRGTGPLAVSTYKIDSLPTYTFRADEKEDAEARVTFYDSGDLEPGEHTLTITLTVDKAYLWLDSFIITENPGPPPPPPSSSSSPSVAPSASHLPPGVSLPTTVDPPQPSSTVESPSSRSTPGPSSAPSASISSLTTTVDGIPKIIISTVEAAPTAGAANLPQPSDAGNESSGPPIGAIVGGALGGLIIILLFILALVLLRRRESRRREVALLAANPHPDFSSPGTTTTSFFPNYKSPTQQGYVPAEYYRDTGSESDPTPPNSGLSYCTPNSPHQAYSLQPLQVGLTHSPRPPPSESDTRSEPESEKSRYQAVAQQYPPSFPVYPLESQRQSGHVHQPSIGNVAPPSYHQAHIP